MLTLFSLSFNIELSRKGDYKMNYKKAIELGKKARQNGWFIPAQDDVLMSMIKKADTAEVVVLINYWHIGLRG